MFEDEANDPPPSKEDAKELENVYHLKSNSNYGPFEEHFDTSADSEVEEPTLDCNPRGYEARVFEEND